MMIYGSSIPSITRFVAISFFLENINWVYKIQFYLWPLAHPIRYSGQRPRCLNQWWSQGERNWRARSPNQYDIEIVTGCWQFHYRTTFPVPAVVFASYPLTTASFFTADTVNNTWRGSAPKGSCIRVSGWQLTRGCSGWCFWEINYCTGLNYFI